MKPGDIWTVALVVAAVMAWTVIVLMLAGCHAPLPKGWR